MLPLLLALSFLFFLVDLRLAGVTTNLLGIASIGVYCLLSRNFSLSRPTCFILMLLIALYGAVSMLNLGEYTGTEIVQVVKLVIKAVICAVIAENFIRIVDRDTFRRAFLVVAAIVLGYLAWLMGFSPGNILLIRSLLTEGGIPLNNTIINFSLMGVVSLWFLVQEKRFPHKLVYLGIGLVLLVIIMASASRQSLLAFMIGAALVLGIKRALMAGTAMVIIVVSSMGVLFQEHFARLFERFAALTTAAGGIEAHVRERQYQIAWELFQNHPFTGAGMRAYETGIGRAGLFIHEAVTESSLSYLLTVGGLVGFGFYVILFVTPLVVLWQVRREFAWAPLLLPLSTMMLFGSLFNENLFNSGVWILFFVAAVYIVRYRPSGTTSHIGNLDAQVRPQ